ncbi:MAG: cell division protein FtsQ/DivIB [Gammaproteobacteria bacterium]|jgi:cell division protein FtsQ|nr:cell division protein FtsQ/DivIB [Gammaproteobacteria bacterium]
MSNKRRLIFVTIMALLLSGWGLNELNFNDISPIEKVEIEGELENIAHDDFRNEVVAVIDGGYFALDLGAIKTALLALPWVDEVSVRRQWPSSLLIKVTEKRAVAYWNDDALISDGGEVFKPAVISDNGSLPRLKGPEGLHNKMWQFLVAANKDFSPMGLEVVNLNLNDRRAWSLQFLVKGGADKVELKLGRDHAENRLVKFVRVCSNIDALNLKNIEAIDLRYPNGFAMREKNNNASKHSLVGEA